MVPLSLRYSKFETFRYFRSPKGCSNPFKNYLQYGKINSTYFPNGFIEITHNFVVFFPGRVYKEMLDNIMGPLMIQEEINIVKYSVYHPMASSANTFIGRAAHIAMLDSELFLEKFILVTANKYFAWCFIIISLLEKHSFFIRFKYK